MPRRNHYDPQTSPLTIQAFPPPGAPSGPQTHRTAPVLYPVAHSSYRPAPSCHPRPPSSPRSHPTPYRHCHPLNIHLTENDTGTAFAEWFMTGFGEDTHVQIAGLG